MSQGKGEERRKTAQKREVWDVTVSCDKKKLKFSRVVQQLTQLGKAT